MLDGWTSMPSRSRVVLSYSARVRRGSCDVAGMPGVHTVGSTGVPEPPEPVVFPVPLLIELPVPDPVVLPVPEQMVLPVPELAPVPEVLFWPPIEPSHPARSATPTMIVFAQVFITLTSSRYSGG